MLVYSLILVVLYCSVEAYSFKVPFVLQRTLHSLTSTQFSAATLTSNSRPLKFRYFLSISAIVAVASLSSLTSLAAMAQDTELIDSQYPGTAVNRLNNIHKRVKSLTKDQLNAEWDSVRRKILWAGGLKDLPTAVPGQGYTGHSFNDFNHCDLTAMRGEVSSNENEGRVTGIHQSNRLGEGIKIASLPELGPGGSWSTCMIGCNSEPPRDVAHVQFQSRIAFKLVWAPPSFEQFVLVDDDGQLLTVGSPVGRLPDISERSKNYRVVQGSKYALEADKLASKSSRELK